MADIVTPEKAGVQGQASQSDSQSKTLDSRLRGNDKKERQNDKREHTNDKKGQATASEEQLMSVKFMCPYDGFSYPEIEPRLFSFNSPYGACRLATALAPNAIWSDKPCPVCEGERLREEALHVKIDGKNIVEVVSHSIEKAVNYFNDIELTEAEKEIAKVVLKEIEARLSFMVNVGIEYLTLGPPRHTLVRRGSPTHSLGFSIGIRLGRRALCFGRTDDWPAPAR